MAFIVKALGAGTITATGSVDGYTVPTKMSAIVTSIRMVHGLVGGLVPTMSVRVQAAGAGTSRALTKNTAVTETAMWVLEDQITLGAGDKLQLDIAGSNGAYALNYSIFGVERD